MVIKCIAIRIYKNYYYTCWFQQLYYRTALEKIPSVRVNNSALSDIQSQLKNDFGTKRVIYIYYIRFRAILFLYSPCPNLEGMKDALFYKFRKPTIDQICSAVCTNKGCHRDAFSNEQCHRARTLPLQWRVRAAAIDLHRGVWSTK